MFHQFPAYQVIGSKAYKPTLENIQRILEFLDNPERDLKFVHVAGSNGKGSTCSMISAALSEAGHRVGLYTSPHIEDYRERIRINGECIDKEYVLEFVERIRKHTFDFNPSFFEITFALSLEYFKAQSCDICVIETGLGGRLDATNVISPLVSAITTISLEHTNILGNTLEEIAMEKAGIIKQNTPAVIGNVSPSLLELFQQVCKERNSHFHSVDSSLEVPANFPLLGSYQHSNFRTATTVLNQLNECGIESTPENLINGLHKLYELTGYRGRLQVVQQSPRTIIDVSHNPEGIAATFSTVLPLTKEGTLHVIFGTSADKDIASILNVIPSAVSMNCCEFSNPRSAKLNDLITIFNNNDRKANFFENLEEAHNHVQNIAKQEDTILIIGSFFLISDFF